jgi:hypothetical protein
LENYYTPRAYTSQNLKALNAHYDQAVDCQALCPYHGNENPHFHGSLSKLIIYMMYTVDPKEKVANKIINWVQHTQHAGLKDP